MSKDLQFTIQLFQRIRNTQLQATNELSDLKKEVFIDGDKDGEKLINIYKWFKKQDNGILFGIDELKRIHNDYIFEKNQMLQLLNQKQSENLKLRNKIAKLQKNERKNMEGINEKYGEDINERNEKKINENYGEDINEKYEQNISDQNEQIAYNKLKRKRSTNAAIDCNNISCFQPAFKKRKLSTWA